VIANDKNYDVRKALYIAVFKLITNFNIIYLRKYEPLLVILMMNGLSDEKSEIQIMCLQYLDDAGKYRKVKTY
jgi:tRNA uridine 5-carbamoylmethylation protein Kti12